MQTSCKYPVLFSILAILFFTSCSKTNKEGRYIPSGASFVLHINGQSLSAKLPWEEIKQSELYKEAYGDSSLNGIYRTVLDNPENSGIDVKKDILLFMVKDTAGDYLALEGSILDEPKFRQFNKQLGKDAAVESVKDGTSFSTTPEMTAAWNKDKFVLVMDGNINRKKYGIPETMDSTSLIAPESKLDKVAVAQSIFNLKEDKSMGKDEKFTALMKNTADMHFWINMESLAAGNTDIPGMQALSMINLKKIYEGSRVAGSVNFENGKISAEFKSYSGKEMTELVKKYSGSKINMDMVKRIPSKDLAALVALNFKPEGLLEYLKLLGVEGFANMGTAMLGFNVEDFVKANKGDILLAVTDIKQDSSGKPDASFIFSASIGDKASFAKLVEAGKKVTKDKVNTEYGPSVFHNINDTYFAIGNKKEAVDAYINSAGTSSYDYLNKITGSAGGVYINFQYILKAMGSDAQKDSLEFAVYDASLKMWDNMTSWSGGYQSGGSVQFIEVNMVDKTTNSLKQLNKYLSTLGMIKKKQDARFTPTAWDNVDSTESNAVIQPK